ncbi:MAG: methyltransferase domain-containing protein [Magnetococcales bacterium]|nr:methyltransferase domain-containing protein [Magnetococcales bacterium]
MVSRSRVAEQFGQASHYHQQATLQRRVAQRLATHIAPFKLPAHPRILEIGCGTGFLSQHLLTLWPHGHLLLSDISPAMVARCQEQLQGCGLERVVFKVLDGENLSEDGPFDLIVSSLAFQWFNDPIGNLATLCQKLAPGGRIAFMTLGEQTFHEWRSLCDQQQIPCGLHSYPTQQVWTNNWPRGGEGEMVEAYLEETHPSPLAFLRGLKQIGTALPASHHLPASGGALRRALRHVNGNNRFFLATYHLLYGCFTKE